MATPADSDILERRATSPMASACLLVSFCMLIGAIAFQLVEIGELRASNLGKATDPKNIQESDFRKFQQESQKQIDANVQILTGLKDTLGEAAEDDSFEEDDSLIDQGVGTTEEDTPVDDTTDEATDEATEDDDWSDEPEPEE